MKQDNTVLSVNDARKLLGKEHENLTNQELVTMINDLDTVVTIILKMYLRSKNVNIY